VNIMEKTPAKIVVRIEGMSFEQVRDLIEGHFGGSLMWSHDGAAYPSDRVSVRIGFGEPASDVAARAMTKEQKA
jgi:hypothetical protein